MDGVDEILREIRELRSEILLDPAIALPLLREARLQDAHGTPSQSRPADSSAPSSDDVGSDVLASRTEFNSQRPINRLPIELLVGILIHLPSELLERPGPRGKAAIATIAVCKHWRTVIEGNSCFWSTLVIGKSARWLPRVLARSKAARLRLTFREPSTLISILSDIEPHASRIECLTIRNLAPLQGEALHPLLGVPLTALRECELHFDRYNPYSELKRYRFEPAHFPQLTRLHLHRATLSWTPALLSRLRSVDLSECTLSTPEIGADEFLKILEHGRDLETFACTKFSPTCPGPNVSPHSRPIFVVPRLRRICLSGSAAWMSYFMSAVQLPTQGYISLEGQFGFADFDLTNDPRPDTFAIYLPQNLEHMHFLRTTKWLQLMITEPIHNILCTTTAGLTVDFKFFPSMRSRALSRRECLLQARKLFCNAPVTDITLAVDFDKVGADVVGTALDGFPKLESLRALLAGMDSEKCTPTVFFEALRASPPSTTPSDSILDPQDEEAHEERALRCPNLKHISVAGLAWGDGSFMDTLVDCLTDRARRGAPRLASLTIHVQRQAGTWKELDKQHAAALSPMVEVYDFAEFNWF
ncbi:hypothetical protein BV20DRAFT_1018488 [Pilatotrama ljubarskyi]|nr:hypothetical protein BV20DRAFT_1018488 [Pilatotrama ljubarskyi]